MIRRGYIKCANCGEEYTLRIGEGSENYQRFYFDCLSCNLPIVIAHRKDTIRMEAIENCRIGTQEGKVINLHASFGIVESKKHDIQFSTALEYLQKITPFIIERYKLQEHEKGIIIDAGYLFELVNTKDMWHLLKNIINSETNKKTYEKLLANYSRQRQKYEKINNLNTYQEAVKDFFSRIFYPKFDDLYNVCVEEIAKAEKEFDAEFSDYKKYFQSHLKKEHFSRFLNVFDDYFQFYENYAQLLTHTRISEYSLANIIVSSKNFNEVNKYYGQIYEALTSNFTTLACINNILSTRKFNQFKTMSLEKYLKTKKHIRANAFQERQAFFACSEYLDNTLRNGINHASFIHEGERVIYKSYDNKKPIEMSYSEYIMKCNELTVRLSVLFCVEILLLRN